MSTIKLSELKGLTVEQVAEKMLPLIEASFGLPNDCVDSIKKQILNYELTYGMTSEEMLKAVELGKLEETEDIAEWAIEYSLLQDLSVSSQPSQFESSPINYTFKYHPLRMEFWYYKTGVRLRGLVVTENIDFGKSRRLVRICVAPASTARCKK